MLLLPFLAQGQELMNYQKSLKYIPAIALSLIVMLAGMILYYILRYGIDVPYMDQWEYVGFFEHLAKGTLTFGELFKQQNEYRQFFPNIIYVFLGWITDWNTRYEMIVIFLLACLTSFNIYRLAKHGNEPWLKWALFFMANLIIFSPGQYENWLFGVQIEYFIPIVCVSSAMVIVFSGMDARWKLVFCMLLAIISTYSSVNGFLCWIVLLPVFLLSGNDKTFFKKWPVVLTWIAGAVVTLIIYFIDYQKPAHHPSLDESVVHPLNALKYFLSVIGNPLRIVHSIDLIVFSGSVLMIAYLALVVYILRHRKNLELMHNSIVWMMLGLYSIMTAAMIMVGRLGFGFEQALSSRYTSFALFLVVAVIYLTSIVFQHWSVGKSITSFQKRGISLLLALFILSRVIAYPFDVKELKKYHANIQHAKAGLLFISYIPNQECVNKIYPSDFGHQLQIKAKVLDSLGYLNPPLVKSNVLQDIEGVGSKELKYGSFDKLIKLNDSIFIASGYSNIPKTNEPSDAIILTYEDGKGKSLLLAFDNKDTLYWKKMFSVEKVTVNPIIIKAWAFDANTAKAYRLKGSCIINK